MTAETEFPDAVKFKNEFTPAEGVDYRWAVQYARDEYGRSIDVFKRLDDKAASVANYVGAGVGGLVVALVTGTAAAQVSPWVAVAALPSLLTAFAALVCAVGSRRAVLRLAPPAVPHAVNYAEYFRDTAEATFLGLWHICIESTHRVCATKAESLNAALRFFVWSVGLLALPLAVAVALKFAGR